MKAVVIAVACCVACGFAVAQNKALRSGEKGYQLGCSISASFTCEEVCDELWSDAQKLAHRDRCSKQAEERRLAAIACKEAANRKVIDRTRACRVQYPTNPTACLDRSSRMFADDMRRC